MTVNTERLLRVLLDLAQRYAPHLLGVDWAKPGEASRLLPELAGKLAGYNLLVMIGNVPPHLNGDLHAYVRTWVENYVRLYDTLSTALFPSFTKISAYYGDDEQNPVIVVLSGAATPVVEALARYITPYIAARQGVAVSDMELIGLIDMVLEALEANDLPREDYRQLRDAAIIQVRQLLAAPLRQERLTEPAPNLLLHTTAVTDEGFAATPEVETPRQATAPMPAPPPAPPSLPEMDHLPPQSDTGAHPPMENTLSNTPVPPLRKEPRGERKRPLPFLWEIE
jgi:hypothetical protein